MHETDLEERIKGDNLMDPIAFDEGEIDKFIRDKSCGFCGGHLFAMHAPDRKYTAHCPEHGAVMSHTSTSKYKAEQMDQNIRAGKAELRQPEKPRPESEILEELGF
jgi:hypothetical protein